MMNYPKYESYKDSGIDWLGEIPSDWEIYPLNAQSKIKSIINNHDEELLSVYLDKGVIRFDDVEAKRTNVTSLDLSRYQLVEYGDFVLNNQQAWRGSVGVSKLKGIVSPAYIILELSKKFHTDYANYLFRDGSMVAHYLISSRGVGTIQRNLYWPQFKNTPVFIPPIQEQNLIAKFLDQKTTQLDEAIRIKEKQIELLKEQKQIMIQNAVTKGLDPNVKMKDSGVDWIGKIPEHWEVKKLKYITLINKNVLPESTPRKEIVQYVDIGSVSFENGINNIEEYTFEVAPSRARRIAKEGDVVVSTVRTYLKAIALVNKEFSNCIFSTGFAVLQPLDEILSMYLSFFTKSDAFTLQVSDASKGMSYPAINSTDLSNLFVTIPSIQEQNVIVEKLERQIIKIDQLIDFELLQIDRFKEYKTTLINSAVTGKIKVTSEMVGEA